jgi:hypothetical protein
MTVDGDPIRVYLSTRSTLDFECVEEWVLFGIVRAQIGHSMPPVSLGSENIYVE